MSLISFEAEHGLAIVDTRNVLKFRREGAGTVLGKGWAEVIASLVQRTSQIY